MTETYEELKSGIQEPKKNVGEEEEKGGIVEWKDLQKGSHYSS